MDAIFGMFVFFGDRNLQKKPSKSRSKYFNFGNLGDGDETFFGVYQKNPLQSQAAQRLLRHKVSPAYQSSGQLPWWLIRCLARATTETGERKKRRGSFSTDGRRKKAFRSSCHPALDAVHATFHIISYHVIPRQGHFDGKDCNTASFLFKLCLWSEHSWWAWSIPWKEASQKFGVLSYNEGTGAWSAFAIILSYAFHLGPSFQQLNVFPTIFVNLNQMFKYKSWKSRLKPRWVEWLSKFQLPGSDQKKPKELLVLWLQGEATPLVARGRDDASEGSPKIISNKRYRFGGFLKWWYPQIIHFKRVFNDFHHPFGGTPIFGNTHLKQATKTTKSFFSENQFIIPSITQNPSPRTGKLESCWTSESLALIWFIKCVSWPRNQETLSIPWFRDPSWLLFRTQSTLALMRPGGLVINTPWTSQATGGPNGQAKHHGLDVEISWIC